jgi:hypothetical protein
MSKIWAVGITRHEAGAEVTRWQAWWTASCGNQSPHRITIAGNAVCQVPIDQTAEK